METQKEKNARVNIWRRNNPDKVWDTNLRWLYGISAENWNEMYAKQKGCCHICGIHQSKLIRRLTVDHDHNTGRVRGLVCINCNCNLGWLEKYRHIIDTHLKDK